MADVKVSIPAPVSKTVAVSAPAKAVSVSVDVVVAAVSTAKAALASGNKSQAANAVTQLLNHQDFQTNPDWQALFSNVVLAIGPAILFNL
jgi:hypothetical protein